MASMGRAKAKPRRLTRVLIREEISRADKALRVDRDKGVIYGVKIVGLSSPNTHGVKGVEGTDYTLEALAKARPLYEGILCNVDHPPRTNPDKTRSAYDRFAWLENVETLESGNFGDLHFLDPKDPLAVKMMNAAENKPDAFALSHNAVGKGEIKDKRYVIHEISEVRSVDIVSEGGTNSSLLEGKAMKKKITLRQIIQESKALTPATRKRLLEIGRNCQEMDDERDVAADGTMEADNEPTPHDHMTNAIGGLVKSEDPDDHDKAGKILKLMRPKEEDVEEEEEGGDTPKDGDTDDDEDESQAGRGNPLKGKGEENSKDDDKGKENMESRQRKAKKRCELAGVEPTADLLESLALVPSRNWDGILLAVKKAGGNNSSAASKGNRSSSAPRSAAAGSVSVQESRGSGGTSKVQDWTKRLLARN